MKTTHHNIIRCIMLAAGLAVAITPTHAANRTWDGGGIDDLWSTGANWGGTAATNADVLFFAGTNRLTPSNTTVTSLNGITFNAGAGSFTLKGSTFTLAGNITNNSGVLQTIENAMTLNGSRIIDTGSGGITLKGGVGETGGARQLTKTGTGTLMLAGANTFTGSLNMLQGTLLLDAASGGSLAAGNYFYFGAQTTTTATNQGGVFEARGASTGNTTVTIDKFLYIGRSSGANRIVVDSNEGAGTTLAFSNFDRNTSPNNGGPTLNIDLSSSTNNAFKLTAATAMQNGIYTHTTVTDATKTGFATRDTNTGLVTRNTAMIDLPTSGSVANTSTSGTKTLVSNTTVNSLTITGSGMVTGNYFLSANAILMEEGVGNYTFGMASVGNGTVFVHQYSTNGTLTISGDLRGSGNYSGHMFSKAGPGAMVFTGTAENIGGSADMQGGSFQLDGSLRAVSIVQVRDGATLSGSGVIGGGTKWGWSGGNTNLGTQYTPVNVWNGGTLNASHSTADALKITGSLALYSGSTYEVNLAAGSFAALSVANITPGDDIVTLDGDLKLTLNYAPTLGAEIDLLTSGGGKITGAFATINGVAATPTFNIGLYEFAINYGENRVWLDTLAIPEPNTAMLLLIAGSLALLRRRR